ncbi:MAG TPA: polyprenyl synthetase family protein [Myxococcota bacterium]|nr:polyprenyl synthetase family protein [Myxococcota bacterium]HNH46391.1 polyprenyl synthetase family protein [Myxococcota bacterium]
MSFSTSSRRALGGRQALLAEVERLGRDVLGGADPFEEALHALADGDGLPPGLTPEMLFVGGIPRIRPLLVSLAARVGSVEGRLDPEAAFEAACVAELLHAGIRVHDAALGRPHGRRRRAARKVLKATWWLGGNHLSLRALEIARRLPAPEILGDLLETMREVAEGHALGEELRRREPTAADAIQHAEGRAGAVFSFACRAGGRLGGVERHAVAGLSRYGRHVGVAWQLSEDLASFERPEERRELLADAAWTRPLYPVAWANQEDPEVGRLWGQVRERGEGEVVDLLAERVRATGGLVAGRSALIQQTWAARQALVDLPETPARQAMERLAGSLARAAA